MPTHKVTNFLSEISLFFKNNDSDHAMFTIMDVKVICILHSPLPAD